MFDTALASYSTTCLLITVLCSFALTLHFAKPETPLIVHSLTVVAYLCSFSIIWLVPLDLLSQHTSQLNKLWQVLYIVSFLLMWLLIPFATEYYNNGAFTGWQRSLCSLKQNAVFYTVALLLYILCLLYLRSVEQLSFADVNALTICLSNIYTLTLLVLLSGYGLIAVPRQLWFNSHSQHRLDWIYYCAATVHHEMEETRDEFITTMLVVKQLKTRIRSEGLNVETFSSYADCIINEMTMKERQLQNTDSNQRFIHHSLHDIKILNDLKDAPHLTRTLLIRLHHHCRNVCRHLSTCESHFADLCDQVVQLKGDLSVDSNVNDIEDSFYAKLTIGGKRSLLRVASLGCAVMSLLLVFCEITIVSNRDVSLLGMLIRSLVQHPLLMQLTSLLPLIYLSCCTYYPLFKLRLSQFYYIGRKRTDAVSLLLNATMLLRVSTSLSYNYVQLLRFDSANDESTTHTALSQLIDSLNVLPLFGRKFTEIFPICIVVVCIATYYNWHSKALNWCGITQFTYLSHRQLQHGEVVDNGDTLEIVDFINEGMTVVKHELRRRERMQLRNANVTVEPERTCAGSVNSPSSATRFSSRSKGADETQRFL